MSWKDTMSSDLSGDRILAGRYQLNEEIATGGMGIVWRAHDTVLNRRVAVKVLPEHLKADQTAIDRFRREALNAAAISHPHMANVYDFVDDGGPPAIVMELVDGETLAERMTGRRRMPIEETVRIASEVLDALQAAHTAGIVHRDIKPGNILLTHDGRVKVADFGIARALTDATITQEGAFLATPHYTSPEQISGEPATARSDLYALGVVLYEMLAGVRPFTGDTPATAALARLNQTPPPPSEHRPAIPGALDAVVMRALHRDPAMRYASASEMRAALSDRSQLAHGGTMRLDVVAADEGTVELEKSRAPALLPPPPSEGKKRLRRTAAMIVIPLVALALVAFLISGLLADEGTTSVPTFTGTSLASARSLAEDADLIVDVRRQNSGRAKDTVIAQSVRPGTEVEDGSRVTLTVSTGCCVVPSLKGKTLADAEKLADGARLDLIVRSVQTDEARAGTIFTQDPAAGSVLGPGGDVTVYVAASDRKGDGDDEGKGGDGGKRGGD